MYFLDFNANDYDWLSKGLFKILLLIAVLQLVKKIPDIINTIFGTKIQPKGGIKGRLGEMAGIGGIAQKAWTSLGTGAKNLAKLGLQAPLAGAYFAANKAYKKNHDEESIKNSKVFREGKGWLYGLRSAVKSGSLLEGYKEYDKMSAAPSYTVADRLSARQTHENRLKNDINKAVGSGHTTDRNGNVMDNYKQIIDDGGVVKEYVGKDGNVHYTRAKDMRKAREVVMEDYTNYGDGGKHNRASSGETSKVALLKGIDSKMTEFSKFADKYISNISNDASRIKEAADFGARVQDYVDGKGMSPELVDYLMENKGVTELGKMLEDYKKIENARADGMQTIDGWDGRIGKIPLSSTIASIEGVAKGHNDKYEPLKAVSSVVQTDAIDVNKNLIGGENGFDKAINGAIQNNSHLGYYIDGNTGNFVANSQLPGSYLATFATGVNSANSHIDYGFADTDDNYEEFDTFIKEEKSKGIDVGTRQFAQDLKTKVATDTNSPLYNGTTDSAIDFITDISSDPVAIFDKIKANMTDAEFTEYVNLVDSTIEKNPNSNIRNDWHNKLQVAGWRRDRNTRKWKK